MNIKIVTEDYKMIKAIESQFIKHCTTLMSENKNNVAMINAIQKTIKKFRYSQKIIIKSFQNKTSYFKTLNKDFKNRRNKETKSHKSSFYEFLNELRKIWYFTSDKFWNPNPIVFKNIINNAPIPKNPKRKYSLDVEQKIANAYFNQKSQNYMFNKINIWKQAKVFFEDISLKTVCEYIKRHPMFIQQKKRVKIKHPLRKWDIDVGNIQLDVKVIGIKDTVMRRKIYVLDAKDQQSKLYWCKLIKTQTKQEMLDGLKEMINFFNGYGVEIKNLRTDNAMVFKKTNWVSLGEFNRMLEEYNINHEFIPLGQPECNGVIERQHRILDEEFVKHNYLIKDFDEYEKRLMEYQEYFNNKRFHRYSFMHDDDNLYTPVEFLRKYLYEQAIKMN